jgi:hypothetical protein
MATHTTHETSPEVKANVERSADAAGAVTPELFGTMTGAALRYDGWPSVHGNVSFGFNWGAIQAGSHVFISASEVDNAGNRFMGAATYTVENVVVKPGRVEFRIFINWGSNLRVSTDIMTINP